MKLRIREPYWTAWRLYGWKKDTWGIGIDTRKVDLAIKHRENIELSIYTYEDIFIADPRKVKEYSIENKTMQTTKGVKLYIVPSTILGKLVEPKKAKSLGPLFKC